MEIAAGVNFAHAVEWVDACVAVNSTANVFA